ncbi:regulator of nonsense transcripts 3A-like [Anopheles albimanus]|uniref:UPF3 domain-containing protein n=1 Tax=Anopheles albimanus TaxID=7167 RepID=A0A182FDB5_ANOAL|nr:regulator of nonsense transcripts 3A-like [Anopheles albimanus]
MDPPREAEKGDRLARSEPGGQKKPDNKARKDKNKDGKGKDGGTAASAGGKDSAGGTKRGKKSKKDVVKPMTRVVVRHLPPTMTEEQFREEISVEGAFPKHEEFYFVGPDWSLGMSATSRAYIKFTNPDDVLLFTHRFDGYTFLDSKGAEFLALVEYAPFQKLPKNRSRSKPDPKCNTIESDPLFIAFKEALEAEEREAQQGRGTQEFSFNLEPEEKIVMTPLLEFVAQRKLEKRDERRRKQEEKRKAREEERSMRKSQIAQAIPESIKEEKEITEIMVRTVPSRLDPAQNASKDNKKGGGGEGGGKHKDEKKARNRNNNKDYKENKDNKDSKDYKDKDRKDRDRKQEEDNSKQATGPRKGDNEKNASKKLDRDKQAPKKLLTAADRDKAKDDPRSSQKKNGRPEKEKPRKGDKLQEAVQVDRGAGDPPVTESAPNVVDPSADDKVAVGKKESKRYSERRKETRARAETRFAEQGDSRNEAKIDVKKSVLMADVPAFIPKQKTTIILHSPSSTATSNPPSTPALPSPMPTTTNTTSSQVVSEGNETTDNGKSPSPETLLETSGKRTAADEEQIRRKLKEAREARKIRNKDRPSMEIYQPRKRIGAAKSEEERWDSDRPSDSVSTAPASAAADGANERRHRLTKKASDRQTHTDRKAARRKNSSDADITPSEAAEMAGTPPASLPEV